MRFRALVVLLIALPVALPVAAEAQNAGPEPQTQLQIEAKRKRLIVRPEPPVAAAARDAEQAAEQARTEQMVQDANPSVRWRPQLDYDVTSAITARNAGRALRR